MNPLARVIVEAVIRMDVIYSPIYTRHPIALKYGIKLFSISYRVSVSGDIVGSQSVHTYIHPSVCMSYFLHKSGDLLTKL